MITAICETTVQGNIKTSHWMVAISAALFVHALFFFEYRFSVNNQGALHQGERGIEIGLKRLLPPPNPIKPAVVTPKIKEPVEPKPDSRPAAVIEPEVIAASEEPPAVEESVTGGGNPDLEIAYASQLLAWLERYKSYPLTARRHRQQDTILLQFVIDAEGTLLSFNLLQSSEFETLNSAVKKMIQRANPLPPVPEMLRGAKTRFTYVVPIEFILNR